MRTSTLLKTPASVLSLIAVMLCHTALYQTAFCQAAFAQTAATQSAVAQSEVAQYQNSSRASELEKNTVGIGLEKCFENLRFQRPILVTHAGDGSDRIFVVEQGGRILVFENGPSPTKAEVFLDISAFVSRVGNEEGLLGLAFHPDYQSNGQFFVSYSSKKDDMLSVIARYTVSKNNANRADRDSQKVVLTQVQPYRNHNGGDIKFGLDGYLYIAFGDGGSADDPHRHGQNLENWLGSILRIDVDHADGGRAYSIPNDNPFVGGTEQGTINAAPEIFAFGLRNVWRFSFDRQTGELWAADVGQNKTEEVNIIQSGGNYGWNRFEANEVFDEKTSLAYGEPVKPAITYDHSLGLSITGGHVYRGRRFPQLNGLYFFADYVSGNLWSAEKTETGTYKDSLVRQTGRSIASFGEDQQGEIYACSFDGYLYRVVPSEAPADVFSQWAQKLSETDIFSSLKDQTISKAYTRYEVNAPFWSDNAIKHRYFQLPTGQKLGYREDGTWSIPVGARIVKHFQNVNQKPIETRLIVRTQSGWEAATYVWNRNGDEADLVPQGKQFELWQPVPGKEKWGPMTWHSPSSSECASCHTNAAGYVLGMNTAQLNRTQNGQDTNQIQNWIKQGLMDIDTFDSKSGSKYCNPLDESVDLETRARVLLEVNCAMCHRPDGPGNANIDLRYATPTHKTKMINTPPAQSAPGNADSKILAPGFPEKSTLWQRMNTLGQGRMPTIGSNVIDTKAVDLIGRWIESLAE